MTASSSEETKQVIIVGGGVGGLAVASRIKSSYESCQITILEKNPQTGGRCGSFVTTSQEFGSFRHERGPSLLLLPDVYRKVFEECSNRNANDYGLSMKQCAPAYQVVFEDGSSIDVGFPRQPGDSMTPEELKSRKLMDSYEENGSSKWDEYMRATSAFLDCGLPNFIEERLDLLSFPNFLLEALRDYAKAWPLKPHSDVLDAIFESEKLKGLASFQDLYVGLEPYRNNELLGGGVLKSTSPAVFGLLAAIELHPNNKKSGVFAPIGGFQSVTNALEQLATELGTTVRCGTTVTSIQEDGVYITDTTSTGSSTTSSIEVSTFLPADLVVVNADLPYATKSLLTEKDPSQVKFDWDDSFSYSSGVISFHWAVSKTCDDLNTHNIFMVTGSRPQAELSWKILRTNQGDVTPDGPFNFYVHRPSKTDPSAAPPGCDSIMVLVPCRTLLRDTECADLPREEAIQKYKDQFSEEVVAQARQAVFKRFAVLDSLKDLERCIVEEVVDTPATWADQFHVAAGTPFALSHGFAQLSLTRPGPASSNIPNVLFCGASTRPGNGVPLVLIGANQVAEKAVNKLEQLDRMEEAKSRSQFK